jgi:tetratricopeptide (TPR) repeat protein
MIAATAPDTDAPILVHDKLPNSHVLVVGRRREDRLAAAAAWQEGMRGATIVGISGRLLPFKRISEADLPPARLRLIRIDDVDQAFPAAQAHGIRLVLTQSSYVLQKWIDLLQPQDCIVATADRTTLLKGAPEALKGRGPWSRFQICDLGSPDAIPDPPTLEEDVGRLPLESLLARAYRLASPEERLQLCREAMEVAPASEVAAVALASACREVGDVSGAREALDLAISLAPDWEAIHYEDGKFWLGVEEMAGARDAFQRASELMPTFSAAHSNLGATLGELGQSEAALAAFKQALVLDPDSFTILNNVGVVTRELGRLQESEAALRRVVSLNPDFVFGHYNLGHTLFLDRQYKAALEAYEEGQRRDSQKNRRQGCRLAIARFANGDIEGAERDLWRFADQAPPDEREDLLLEAYEIAHALVAELPQLTAQQAFLDRIASEITK